MLLFAHPIIAGAGSVAAGAAALYYATYAVRTPAYFTAARRLGLRTVQWSVAGFDWKKRRTAAEIAARVLRRAQPGAIILLHDGDSSGRHDRTETISALPAIIEGLQARG